MAQVTQKAVLRNRTDSAANWAAANPVLSSGEIGVESNTGLFKIGDGATAWNALGYGNGFKVVTVTVSGGTGTITGLADRTIYRFSAAVNRVVISSVASGWGVNSAAHLCLTWGASPNATPITYGSTDITTFKDVKPEAGKPCEISVFNNKAVIANGQ